MARRQYTNLEICIVKDHLDMSIQDLQKEFFPYRTISSVKNLAKKCGWESKRAKANWTQEEDDILRNHLELRGTEIHAQYLPDKPAYAINRRFKALGLMEQHQLAVNDAWDAEKKLFAKLYESGGVRAVKSNPAFANMSDAQIVSRGHNNHLKDGSLIHVRDWKKYEEDILLDNVNLSSKQVSEYLHDDRTARRIDQQYKVMGINRRQLRAWDTETKIKFADAYVHGGYVGVQYAFRDIAILSKTAIYGRARRMHIRISDAKWQTFLAYEMYPNRKGVLYETTIELDDHGYPVPAIYKIINNKKEKIV